MIRLIYKRVTSGTPFIQFLVGMTDSCHTHFFIYYPIRALIVHTQKYFRKLAVHSHPEQMK